MAAANGAEGDHGHSPVEQFVIKPLGGHGETLEALPFYTFTNSALVMVIAVLLVLTILSFGMRRGALIPGRWQSLSELTYEFVANMIRDNVGQEGRKYFPLIFTLFMFVLAGNMLGMVPYSFTFTSHIAVTPMKTTIAMVKVTAMWLVKVKL